jgi:hypothetical protein
MEKAMRVPLIAIAALAAAGSSLPAQPVKDSAPESAKPAQPVTPRAPIVLASVDTVRAPTGDAGQPASSPVKRQVAPRITTCRCGPPHAQPDPDEE